MSVSMPIFPLNTVLFPGAPLPLRVFEPRYRKMLEDCLKGGSRFGVTLIKTGVEVGGPAEPHLVGTVAHIVRVRDEDRGAIPIDTRGEERFRITSLDRTRAYLIGEVEFLSDELDDDSQLAAAIAREAAEKYIRVLLAVQGEWHRIMELPSDPLKLSHFLGTVLLGLPGAVRQEILEADPVSHRLRVAVKAIETATDETQKTLMRSGPGKGRTVFGLN